MGKLVPIEESCFYSRNVERFENNDGTPKSEREDKAWVEMHTYSHKGKFTSKNVTVDLSPLGLAASKAISELRDIVDGLTVCAKQIMPDHIHVVIWVTKDCGRSIRQIGNGYRIGIKRKAIELGAWPENQGHVLGIPYIWTLFHKGQLGHMIDYVHANPDNAWARHLNSQLYVIRRNIELAGLHFDGMGKTRLLDYPDCYIVALSRSLTAEQIDAEVTKALRMAERGAVIYTAAINDGEKAVSKAIREHGYPLVVMMLDGFPTENTEAARYFHPKGVYHKISGEGRLMLLAPKAENYANIKLKELTEQELIRKVWEKVSIILLFLMTASVGG